MKNRRQALCEQSIGSIEEGKPDDLFVACVSFEPRCTYAASILDKNAYRARSVLLLRYHGDGEQKDKSERELLGYLKNVDLSGSLEATYFDKYEVETFYGFLRTLCKDRAPLMRVTVDITTLTKRYLLILLDCMRRMLPQAKIRLLYTPGVYASNEVLSWGVKEVSVLPYLGGACSESSKKRALALLLGYEGERAYSILRYVEPMFTLAVVANPPTHPGDDIPSRKRNRIILEDPRTVEVEVPALWPDETQKILRQWYEKPEYKDYTWYISPLGTKMQTVGVYLFFESLPPDSRAEVLYASPLKYNKKKYTVDYDHNCIVYQMPALQGVSG